MDKAKLLEQLMATFLDELGEHVRTLNDSLLELEKAPDDARDEVLAVLFRAAHSLKGASRAVDVAPIAEVCHRMEDVFSAVRDGRYRATDDCFSTLFATADAIEAAGMQLREKTTLSEDAFDHLHARLDAILPEVDSDEPQDSASPMPATAAPSAPRRPLVERAIETDGPATLVVQPAEATPVAEPQSTEQPAATKSLAASVRVAESKLDALLAQTAELLVARQRVEGRSDDVSELLDFVDRWLADWKRTQHLVANLLTKPERETLLQRSTRLREAAAEVVRENGRNLRSLGKRLEQLQQAMTSDGRQLNHAGRSLQEEVHRIRMLPFSQACTGLERAVRDLARSTGKDVELIVQGGDIEVDRAVLDGLADPLKHLVRNSVDHGVEPPDDRRAAGKKLPARITVKASLRGPRVEIVVADDGRGLNLERIRQRVRERRLPEPADDRDLVRCIFLPGFSTAEIITDVSGRGVGMDVVKSSVEALHGSIDVASEAGLGTRFTLSVPLTLTTLSSLLVQAGGQTFAVATDNVVKLQRFDRDDIRSMNGRDVLPLGRTPIPVVRLADVLRIGDRQSTGGKLTGMILSTGEQQTLFVVDAVATEREIVVKSLGPRIRRTKHVSGATLLPSGEIALLLNAVNLIRSATDYGRMSLAADAEVELERSRRRLLVVDDSVTTRTLLKTILESAGYDVIAAVDGRDGWTKLQHAPVDLVLSDVDMPLMNGFELTETIRTADQTRQMPVVLLTARESDDDKARGVRAGADAYLVKSTFDQENVLDTIEQLLR